MKPIIKEVILGRHVVDDLFPNGRPYCRTCGERPVYLAGECGPCYSSHRAPAPIDGDEPASAEEMDYNAADNLGGVS